MNALDRIRRLTLVGGGNMGGAMLDGWLAGGFDGSCVELVDPGISDERRAEWTERGIDVVPAAKASEPDLLLVAVKPQIMDEVLPALRTVAGPSTAIVSVAAGVTLERMRRVFAAPAPLVRAMPNTPAQVGRGVTVCCPTAEVDAGMRDAIAALMAGIGGVEWVEDEGLMDAVTAVSGSGPAYAFHLAEALAAAGEKAGLPADLAARIATATVAGAGELMHRSFDPPARLREAVTSPNGTTQAGLEVLMAELPELMERTVAAAAKRSRELA